LSYDDFCSIVFVESGDYNVGMIPYFIGFAFAVKATCAFAPLAEAILYPVFARFIIRQKRLHYDCGCCRLCGGSAPTPPASSKEQAKKQEFCVEYGRGVWYN